MMILTKIMIAVTVGIGAHAGWLLFLAYRDLPMADGPTDDRMVKWTVALMVAAVLCLVCGVIEKAI